MPRELPSDFRLSRKRFSGRHFSLMLIRDPVLRELNRRAVAERGVEATPVLEHFDVVEQIRDRVLSCRVARTVPRSFFKLLKKLSVGALSQ